MIFCENDDLVIKSDLTGDKIRNIACSRITLPFMDEEQIKDIERKPYICTKDVNFFIYDKRYFEEYRIFIPEGYTWDGATIPFGFRWMLGGKGNPTFLIASCVHDKLCECKWLIDYDRKLSSMIFKELLIACGCNKIKAQTMYICVDNFQKLCKWD